MNFEVVHPMFSEDLQGGGYSFPIEIENNDENNDALGFPSMIKQDDVEFKSTWDIYFKGHFWKRGVLIIDRPGTKKHSGYIRTGLQSFAVLDKMMSEVDYGGDFDMGDTPADVINFAKVATYYNFQWWQNGFVFPTVYAPNFYEDLNPSYLGFINRFERVYKVYHVNTLGTPPNNTDCLVPMMYVMHALRKIFEEEGYYLPDNALDAYTTGGGGAIDSGLDKMILWNNVPLDSFGESHFGVNIGHNLPKVYFGGFSVAPALEFGDENSPYSDPDNVYDDTTFRYTIQVEGQHRIKLKFNFTVNSGGGTIPYYAVVRAIGRIVAGNQQFAVSTSASNLVAGNTYEVSFDVSPNFTSADVGEEIEFLLNMNNITSLQSITVNTSSIQIEVLQNSFVNLYSTTMNLKNHVPEMSVRDFLTNLRTLRGLDFIPDETFKEMRIIMRPELIEPPDGVEDITSRVMPDHRANINEDSVRSIGYEWPSDDDLLTDNFKEYDRNLDTGAVNSVADLPTPVLLGQTVRVKDLNVRYITGVDIAGALEWQKYRDDYDDYYFDPQGHVELRSSITPMLMTEIDDTYTNITVMPHTMAVARSAPFGVDGGATSARFMYFCPNAADALGSYYPFATSQPSVSTYSAENPGSRFIMNGSTPDSLLLEHWVSFMLRSGKFLWENDIDLDWAAIQNLNDFEKGIYFIKALDKAHILIKQVSISLGEQIGVSQIQFIRR
jgi:hypothetical protein